MTFIQNIKCYEYINHIDGNKLNNNLDNLEWCTHLQNMQHAFKNRLINNTNENNGMAKLNKEQVIKIKELLKKKMSQQKIANIFGVSRSAILKINLKKTWSNI